MDTDTTPRKLFHYFPLGPRLQRWYAYATTANHMRWHAEHRSKDGEMCHPSDSEAQLTFIATHPDFAWETRNVRLGLCSDGFICQLGTTIFMLARNINSI